MKFDNTITADEIFVELGKRLTYVRLDRMLTQADLARRAGVSKRSLERLENGEGNIQLKVFLAVCVALGLSPKFDLLLPERTLGPEEIFQQKKLPQRARKRKSPQRNLKWGDEQ